jgi:3-methyladenine DNA glycosylase/8-oxoguanine DNA glycosylase
MAVWEIGTPADFSLRETIEAHGWHQLLPFRWDREAGVLERVEEVTHGRVVLLRIAEPEAGRLTIEGAGAAERAEVTARVRRMLQLDLALEAFHTFCAERPGLAHVPERRQGRMLRCATLWEDAVKVILTTNTTWGQTKSMSARILNHFGAPCPTEPERRAFPGPERIAAVSLEDFAEVARVGYRAAAIHGLACDIQNGATELEALQTEPLDTPTLRKRLLALRGVGPYAAATLLLYLGSGDHINVDSWARTLVGKELGRPVTDAEVHAFFADYTPWRGLAYSFYAWRT